MVSGINIALSGLRAMTRKMDTAAHNTANALTDGFKKSRTINRSLAGGGVETVVEQVDAPGPRVVDPDTGQTRELSNTDLAEELLNLITALRGAEANLATIKAEDEMSGTIIDTLV